MNTILLVSIVTVAVSLLLTLLIFVIYKYYYHQQQPKKFQWQVEDLTAQSQLLDKQRKWHSSRLNFIVNQTEKYMLNASLPS
jgi:hypothetical protein